MVLLPMEDHNGIIDQEFLTPYERLTYFVGKKVLIRKSNRVLMGRCLIKNLVIDLARLSLLFVPTHFSVFSLFLYYTSLQCSLKTLETFMTSAVG